MSKRKDKRKREHTLGDAPIENEYHEIMNKLAVGLDKILNGDQAGPRAQGKPDQRKNGFVLLVFPFEEMATRGGESRCNFISNGADRRDIVALFKEMIARFEGQPEMEGRA